METKERMKIIQERFKKLKDSNDLVIGRAKNKDFSQNQSLNVARQIIKNHLNSSGRTEVPISFKEYAEEIGYNRITDFNHFRDKMIRLFEVALITELNLEDSKSFNGLYKSNNTTLIRKHITRGKNLFFSANRNDERDLYLSVDMSDLPQFRKK